MRTKAVRRTIVMAAVATTLLLSVARAWPAGARTSRSAVGPAATVACVGGIYPPSASLAEVARIERRGATLPLAGNDVDLQPGDRIYLKSDAVAVRIHMIAIGQDFDVSWRPDKKRNEADYTVPTTAIPGAGTRLVQFFKRLVVGRDDHTKLSLLGGRGLAGGAESGGTSSPCFNQSGETNRPQVFRVPALAAGGTIASGPRELFISWRGGTQPFSVELHDMRSGSMVAHRVGIRGACAARLPRADLPAGEYRLTVTDGNDARQVATIRAVTALVPSMPSEIADAPLPPDARTIYFATWLTLIERGAWTLQAQQEVAARGCRSNAVKEWLESWGGTPPECASARRGAETVSRSGPAVP